MNNKLIGVLAFTAGASIGAVVAWKFLEKKHEDAMQEEIDSIKKELKEYFSKKYSAPNNEDFHDYLKNKPTTQEDKQESVTEEIRKIYNNVISDKGYTNYSDFAKSDSDEEDDSDEDEEDDLEDKPVYAERDTDMDEPYVISPEEFGELDYEKISLTYYADDVLADEFDGLVENIDSIVGLESLNTFGEYEDDSVFVRNDKLRCDYEILKDLRRWEDVVNPPKPKTRKASPKKPHQMEE